MSAISAATIINKASKLLHDISNVKWTRAELLSWINDAQRQIVILSPNATNKVSTIKLVAGTRQSLPSDGWTLLEVLRNMGTSGTTPGRAIRLASRSLLDAFNPNWHDDSPVTAPINYLYDIQDQTVFYVYPPANGNGYIQINYSPDPSDLTAETDAIYVPKIFETAILDYVLYRACSKNSDYAPNAQLAIAYYTAFNAAMSQKSASESGNSPNQQFGPKNSDKPGMQS
jgi:hypothetical protein